MSVTFHGSYQGDLRVKIVHDPSGTVLETDAPLDNNGKGERFSPTDLVVTALSACLLTIMGIVAKRDGIDLTNLTFKAEKQMATDLPRRIAKIIIEVTMPKHLTQDQRKKLENAARTCPVYYSLNSEIEKVISFI